MHVPLGVTFDFGQTLADLDTAFLSSRLAERGLSVAPALLEVAAPAAQRAYNQGILASEGSHDHPWSLFMRELLRRAGADPARLTEVADWLWSEQPRKNLWRRPIPGMFELVRRLRDRGVAVGVISNSEGRLAELAEEMGVLGLFSVIADSGRLGIAKPDRAIFDWAAAQLGLAPESIVHIGDSFAADVQGALGAGMRAIWFRGEPGVGARQRSYSCCAGAEELERALVELGLL